MVLVTLVLLVELVYIAPASICPLTPLTTLTPFNYISPLQLLNPLTLLPSNPSPLQPSNQLLLGWKGRRTFASETKETCGDLAVVHLCLMFLG